MFNSEGNFYYGFFDWSGKPIKKTPYSYPYSFDDYVIYKKQYEYQTAVYSDRLYQWNPEKYDLLSNKHFGNKGQSFDGRSVEEIEAFLKEYLANESLELIGIIKGCNISNGYPYWVFMYNINHLIEAQALID